jgi:hypothetical protein
MVRLDVDRVDPENRDFRHPDPIGWTQSNRAEILAALYTILLGNPTLDLPRSASMKTRFKLWYRTVGAAVEHAAQCAVSLDPDVDHLPEQPAIDFGTLFLDQEGDDEEATSLGEMLAVLGETMKSRDITAGRKPEPFTAAEVAAALNSADASTLIVKGFLYPGHPSSTSVTPKSVGRLLRKHAGQPVKHGARTLVLRAYMDKHAEVLKFQVEAI